MSDIPGFMIFDMSDGIEGLQAQFVKLTEAIRVKATAVAELLPALKDVLLLELGKEDYGEHFPCVDHALQVFDADICEIGAMIYKRRILETLLFPTDPEVDPNAN